MIPLMMNVGELDEREFKKSFGWVFRRNVHALASGILYRFPSEQNEVIRCESLKCKECSQTRCFSHS
ncbi:MAG: hypothetical protein ACK53G_01055, partial [Armatimonadota bacterium]